MDFSAGGGEPGGGPSARGEGGGVRGLREMLEPLRQVPRRVCAVELVGLGLVMGAGGGMGWQPCPV